MFTEPPEGHTFSTAVSVFHFLCHLRANVSVRVVVLTSYHADLRNTGDDKLVDEVILSAHFAEEEVDFLLVRDETGADEGWI